MQDFKIGQTYEFETIEIRQDDRTGVDYIALRDDTCDTYRIYNILKFQYDELPEKITAIVKSIDPFGRPKLKQETASIYKKIYEFGKDYVLKSLTSNPTFVLPSKPNTISWRTNGVYIVATSKNNFTRLVTFAQ